MNAPAHENERMIHTVVRYRRYILQNAWQDLRTRYIGSVMGPVWTLLLPLVQVLVFTVLVARLRAFGPIDNPLGVNGYILWLTVGLFPWTVFAQSLSAGSQSLQNNSLHLRTLAIPEEVFVAQAAANGLFQVLIYLVILAGVAPFVGVTPGPWVVLVPAVALLFQMLAFGLSLMLASLQVLFQDVGQVVTASVGLILWTMPIVYPEPTSPTAQAVLAWHPFYPFIAATRQLFLSNQLPPASTWGAMIGWTLTAILIGTVILERLRSDLRDFL
jgi:lipopolysaccharide transport system permease protein